MDPAAITLRLLERDELDLARGLDRRELIERVYHMQGGVLVLRDQRYDMQGWPPGEFEHILESLHGCLERGGWVLGALEGARPVGIVSLEPEPPASGPDQLQLSLLNVSHGYRDRGLGGRLFEAARAEARRRGARDMYVSATPSEHTIRFYLAHGCRLNPAPDPQLLAAEPEDIHLLCAT